MPLGPHLPPGPPGGPRVAAVGPALRGQGRCEITNCGSLGCTETHWHDLINSTIRQELLQLTEPTTDLSRAERFAAERRIALEIHRDVRGRRVADQGVDRQDGQREVVILPAGQGTEGGRDDRVNRNGQRYGTNWPIGCPKVADDEPRGGGWPYRFRRMGEAVSTPARRSLIAQREEFIVDIRPSTSRSRATNARFGARIFRPAVPRLPHCHQRKSCSTNLLRERQSKCNGSQDLQPSPNTFKS